MIDRILTVGGITLLSRVTGFMRDIILAAVLGAGPVADAFFVALRLPNHFRAIFAEGAFNAAFIPAYARVRGSSGEAAVRLFADRVFVLLLASQVVLLGVALLFTPVVIGLLAPGFSKDPGRFTLAVDLTRITFPYLLLVSLVTLYGGILNALDRFAAAAAAPILLNLSMMMTLALAAFFPSAGHAAAWGVLLAGILEFLLVAGDAARNGVLPRFAWPKLDGEVLVFLKRFGPATIGSAGTQIALFADTIIASFLAAGALSALYYADRLNQLPIGVIGIAVGTVLLPEMSRRITAGDEEGAKHAQNRAVEFALVLSVPCLVAFVMVPDLIMRGLFSRGAFTAADAHAAGATLAVYAIGLLPFVLTRNASTTFLARGDTATPVKALFAGVTVNVILKVLLMGPYAQVGLAFATSVGAWINVGLLFWFAYRQNLILLDRRLRQTCVKLVIAAVVLATALWLTRWGVERIVPEGTSLRNVIVLVVLVAVGGVVYGGVAAILFGQQLLSAFRRKKSPPPSGQ
ncbi:murein biosynthesis integral membrane protein MurJ [Rhodoplanes sp. Z2-YC6860]|uniref:murein biosynthesis integral membrane protein MurJ n=1 Tax=Rhodoplanes sp. Z2-YC6860 TaxID=674703 RepID=UPI00078EB523|nr:murein biosynthesis integral membrane protein MurJ [Rhodoplanes sp. Z2-YC6860]AMN43407.1 virulence factor MviN [Rhodoplanes sp. Z2-YC6860]